MVGDRFKPNRLATANDTPNSSNGDARTAQAIRWGCAAAPIGGTPSGRPFSTFDALVKPQCARGVRGSVVITGRALPVHPKCESLARNFCRRRIVRLAVVAVDCDAAACRPRRDLASCRPHTGLANRLKTGNGHRICRPGMGVICIEVSISRPVVCDQGDARRSKCA